MLTLANAFTRLRFEPIWLLPRLLDTPARSQGRAIKGKRRDPIGNLGDRHSRSDDDRLDLPIYREP